MANSKYEGGARITTFRLPLKHFEEAKKGIEQYLSRYENKKVPDALAGVPLTPEECYGENPKIETLGDRLVSFENKANVAELNAMQKEALWKEALLNKNMLGSLENIPVGDLPNAQKMEEEKLLGKAKKKVVLKDEVGQFIKPSKKIISPELKEKLLKLDPNIVVPQDKAYEKDGSVYYPCGCHLGLDKFYRNVSQCALGYSKEHKEKYGV